MEDFGTAAPMTPHAFSFHQDKRGALPQQRSEGDARLTQSLQHHRANLEVQLKAKGVKYVLPSFIDMHGIPKAKMVPLDHLHGCCRGSELFTGAAVDGVPQAVSDDEVCAVADPATMAVPLPYRRDPLAKAVFGDRMHAAWVEYKRAEWTEYTKHVSDWEVARYLRQFG